MVNEIPVAIFIVMLIFDLLLVIFSLYDTEKVTTSKIISSSISALLSFILANTIINGNVIMAYASSDSYNYIPIQSQPLNYFLLGCGVTMSVLAAMYTFMYIHGYIQSTKEFSAMGEWAK